MPPNKKSTTRETVWKNASQNETWGSIVVTALTHCHPPAMLSELYALIAEHPKVRGRKHWKAKVRQTLELSEELVRIGPGTWDFASQHSAKAIRKFDRKRRKRYPKKSTPHS